MLGVNKKPKSHTPPNPCMCVQETTTPSTLQSTMHAITAHSTQSHGKLQPNTSQTAPKTTKDKDQGLTQSPQQTPKTSLTSTIPPCSPPTLPAIKPPEPQSPLLSSQRLNFTLTSLGRPPSTTLALGIAGLSSKLADKIA